jgi:hypothetical protein
MRTERTLRKHPQGVRALGCAGGMGDRARAPNPARRVARGTSWPLLARVGTWRIRIQPWPEYDEHGRLRWLLVVSNTVPGFRPFWLHFDGVRLVDSLAARELLGVAPGVAAGALRALRDWWQPATRSPSSPPSP